MDPLTITGSCVGLLASITALSVKATEIVGQFRDSRKDMEAVRSELSALSLCVETLRDDASNVQIKYPPSVEASLIEVLQNCETTTQDILTLLDKYASNNIVRRVQWIAASGDVDKLRSRLSAQKSTISIALDMTNILLVSAVAADTAEIKADTAAIPQIKDDTTQLLEEISQLKSQLAQITIGNEAPPFALQRFLDETTTVFDDDDIDVEVGSNHPAPEHHTEDRPSLPSLQPPSKPVLRPVVVLNRSRSATDVPAPAPVSNVPPSDARAVGIARMVGTQEDIKSAIMVLPREIKWTEVRAGLGDAERTMIDNRFIGLFKAKLVRSAVDSLCPDSFADQARHLLESGADVNTTRYHVDSSQHAEFTALSVLARLPNVRPCIKMLLSFKPDVNQKLLASQTPAGTFPVYNTALLYAVLNDQDGNIIELLRYGADPNVVCGIYGSALATATRLRHPQAMLHLIEHGAKINMQSGIFGSPLHTACSHGYVGGVKLLLEAGADPNLKCSDLGTPLQVALKISDCDHEEMVTLLKKYGAKASLMDSFKLNRRKKEARSTARRRIVDELELEEDSSD